MGHDPRGEIGRCPQQRVEALGFGVEGRGVGEVVGVVAEVLDPGPVVVADGDAAAGVRFEP